MGEITPQIWCKLTRKNTQGKEDVSIMHQYIKIIMESNIEEKKKLSILTVVCFTDT